MHDWRKTKIICCLFVLNEYLLFTQTYELRYLTFHFFICQAKPLLYFFVFISAVFISTYMSIYWHVHTLSGWLSKIVNILDYILLQPCIELVLVYLCFMPLLKQFSFKNQFFCYIYTVALFLQYKPLSFSLLSNMPVHASTCITCHVELPVV